MSIKNSLNNKHSEDLVVKRYIELKEKVEDRYREEQEYDMISPYSGLDVIFHYSDESLYNEILNYQEDEYFMNRALFLFKNDYPNFFNEEINKYKHIVYIIEHKEDYYKIANYKEQIGNSYYEINCKIDRMMLEKNNKQIEMDELLDAIKDLENRKYSIFEFFTNKKKNIKNLIYELKNKVRDFEIEVGKISKKIETCREELEYYEVLHNKIETISSKLQYPLEEFNIIGENENDMYINGRYYEMAILDRLCKNEVNYINNLEKLKKMQEIASDKKYEININKANKEIEYQY